MEKQRTKVDSAIKHIALHLNRVITPRSILLTQFLQGMARAEKGGE